MMLTELLTTERLPGELLSGSERQRPGWFLDMKYQSCFHYYRLTASLVTCITLIQSQLSYRYVFGGGGTTYALTNGLCFAVRSSMTWGWVWQQSNRSSTLQAREGKGEDRR